MKKSVTPIHGGFMPSIMGGVLKSGPYFMTAAISQGSRLMHNNRKRMATRRRGRQNMRRRRHTRRVKRSGR